MVKKKEPKLKQDPNNYNAGTAKGNAKIGETMDKVGYMRSGVAAADGTMIVGNKSLQQAEAREAPIRYVHTKGDEYVVVVRDDIDGPEDPRFQVGALADNATAAMNLNWSGANLVKDFDPIDLEAWDIHLDWPDEDAPKAESVAPEAKAEAITESGDVYELNGHRLICGDSVCAGVYHNLLGDIDTIDLLATDPPYGAKKESEGILNDNQNQNDLLEFNRDWFGLAGPRLSDVGSVYVFGYEEPLMDFYQFIFKDLRDRDQATFRNWITWDKGVGQGQNSEHTRSYARATEHILFFMLGVQGFNNNADNYYEGWEPVRSYLKAQIDKLGWGPKDIKEITGVGMYSHWFTKSQWVPIPAKHYNALREAAAGTGAFDKDAMAFAREYQSIKAEHDRIKAEFYQTRGYFNNTHDNMNDVWHFTSPMGEDRHGHASPKPLALMDRIILSSCPPGGTVLDPFLGSGTTLMSAERNGRECYGVELSPNYCDVIVRRWVAYMEETARPYTIKRNGEDITGQDWTMPTTGEKQATDG